MAYLCNGIYTWLGVAMLQGKQGRKERVEEGWERHNEGWKKGGMYYNFRIPP